MMKRKFTYFFIFILLVFAGSYFFYTQAKNNSKTSQNKSEKIEIKENSFALAETKEKKPVTFTIAGDAMFDRNVWHNFKDIGLNRIFDNFDKNVFAGKDLAFLNLEGPISKDAIDDDWQSGSLVFNFPPETPKTLNFLGINTVSLANNHTMNAGKTGFQNTKEVLKINKINYFGRQNGFLTEEDVLRIDSEIPLSLIGIQAIDKIDNEEFSATIKAEKSAGRFVIIFPHWGTEYEPKHNSVQKSLAKEWVSVGADMIIGSHPHVTEDFEVIDNVPVVYSLGNFVFDQFFSKETQEGLVLSGEISEKSVKIQFLPTKEIKVRPQFMTGNEKDEKIATVFDINSQNGFTKISSDTIEIIRK